MSVYITTPIYYVNAQPHLGHAYTTIVADTYSRFKRLTGATVRFQTGTDEHGDKVVEAADRAGVSPQEYTDRISAMFKDAWPPLDVAYDRFIRTTDPDHIRTVQAILQRVYDQGDIYAGSYSGLYCKGCERFLTEKELVDGNCPDHQAPPTPITEENYFFRMSKYQEWLMDHINSHPEFITPERYRNEVLSFLKEPLEDLCISRPTSRLTWGIPLPFDAEFVTYVWFDALINYLTGLGYPDGANFKKYWASAEHIIAKDILKPHAIYWPTMLRAMNIAPFRRLHVHGYWNINETKMSKTIGNVVRPGELVDKFGPDTVRYFVLREMSFGVDSSFSTDKIRSRHNSDLANDLGNLFSRSLTMITKFNHGLVPEAASPEEPDRELAETAMAMVREYAVQMDTFGFNKALQEVWKVISLANRYIVTNAPWELAKDPAKAKRLRTVLYHLAEALRLVALVLQPIMPAIASRMNDGLGLKAGPLRDEPNLGEHGQWGLLAPGSQVHLDESLFPRLIQPKDLSSSSTPIKTKEKKQVPTTDQTSATEKTPPVKTAADDNSGLIAFDEFKKLDLRVGEIMAAERIKKSDRLLKLTIRTPEERTVVAGLAEHFHPDELIGKLVLVVANLKPAKLMGVTSHGMVLAVRDSESGILRLATVAGSVAAGSKIS